ncbi:MAG: ArsR/SmtB family transcription factor [Candidatus Hodarchaeales archaeon]
MADEYKKEKDDEFSSKSDSGDFNEIKNLFRELKEEIREEFQDIREEIEDVKGPEKRSRKKARRRTYRRSRDEEDWKDWGENIGSSLERYIGSILESVWDSVDQSVGSLFHTSSTPRRRRTKRDKVDHYTSIPEEELEQFFQRGAELLSALSDQKRLQMLKELEKEPLRQSDLSEKTNIRGGNFKHHITILKDEGLVHQEGVRERYMLTFAGREALKLAEFLYHRAKKPVGVPIIIDEDESDSKSEEE